MMDEKVKAMLEEVVHLLKGEIKYTTYSNSSKKHCRIATIEYPPEDFPIHIQYEEKDSGKYVFGGMEVHSTNVLRVISELESAFQMLKYLGFEEDMITLQEIKSRYYKMYFKLAKQEKSMLE